MSNLIGRLVEVKIKEEVFEVYIAERYIHKSLTYGGTDVAVHRYIGIDKTDGKAIHFMGDKITKIFE